MTSRVDQVVRLTRRFTRKPIILSEVASGAKGGNKAGWLRTGYVQTYNRYPQVKGIMYLDTDQPHIGRGHPDWRLIKPEDGATLADGSAVRSYRALANNPRFKGRIK
jgi:hypothetical protein